MRNCKKLIIKMLSGVILVITNPVDAGGIPVFDAANMQQSTVTAVESVAQTLKQIQEYQLQLQQYEDQIRNTIAPAAYLWARAEYTMNRLVQLSNTLKYYQNQGGIDAYLARYRNASYYSNSPCFKLTTVKCTAEEWRRFREGQANSTQAQKSANDAALKGLEQHQLQAPLDAAHLQQLQANAQTAQGRLEAIQYANQLAAYQSNQLLQLKTMMIAQYNAENAREQARVDREAMQQAAHEQFTRRLSPTTFPAPKTWNVRDAF